jgi:NarL family two-component system response regulator LiaR
VRILVLTDIGTEDKVFAAIKAGAVGFLLKDSEPGDLVRAIHEVYRDEAWLHPSIARKLLREISESTRKHAVAESLTEREMDVLRLIAHGLSNHQIADQLTISEGTVRVHVSNILGKLHLASRTQVALYALREGWTTLEDTGIDRRSEGALLFSIEHS